MSPLWSGLLAVWVVVRLTRARGRVPWAVLELTADHPPGGPPEPGSVGEHATHTPPSTTSGDRERRPARDDRPDPLAPRPSRPSQRSPARRERRAQRAIEADLPPTVDLLHIAVTAGHSLHTAVAAVGGVGQGPVRDALAEADRRFRHGGRLVDELEALAARLGPSVRPLSTTLVVAASSGAPLGPALQRLADAERRRLRRRTEERVRRLPVVLLAPLVGLVLPAFVLLTVVPVAITTARTGLDPAAVAPASADAVLLPDVLPSGDLPSNSIVRSPP